MRYLVPVTYTMYGKLEIEALDKEEAEAIAYQPITGLPEKASYVEGSFYVDTEEIIAENENDSTTE